MLIHFEDQDYEFDLDDIDVPQARVIKRQTGLGLLKLQEGLSELDPECMVAIYWLMKVQNGKAVDMNKVNFKILHFAAALAEAVEQENKENPTKTPEAPATAKK